MIFYSKQPGGLDWIQRQCTCSWDNFSCAYCLYWEDKCDMIDAIWEKAEQRYADECANKNKEHDSNKSSGWADLKVDNGIAEHDFKAGTKWGSSKSINFAGIGEPCKLCMGWGCSKCDYPKKSGGWGEDGCDGNKEPYYGGWGKW